MKNEKRDTPERDILESRKVAKVRMLLGREEGPADDSGKDGNDLGVSKEQIITLHLMFSNKKSQKD